MAAQPSGGQSSSGAMCACCSLPLIGVALPNEVDAIKLEAVAKSLPLGFVVYVLPRHVLPRDRFELCELSGRLHTSQVAGAGGESGEQPSCTPCSMPP